MIVKGRMAFATWVAYDCLLHKGGSGLITDNQVALVIAHECRYGLKRHTLLQLKSMTDPSGIAGYTGYNDE